MSNESNSNGPLWVDSRRSIASQHIRLLLSIKRSSISGAIYERRGIAGINRESPLHHLALFGFDLVSAILLLRADEIQTSL